MARRTPSRAVTATLVAGIGILSLVGLGIFVLPFAFPTPPPVVAGFTTTLRISPNGDRRNDLARVNVRMNESGRLNLFVVPDGGGDSLKSLAVNVLAKKGWFRTSWGGRDEAGRPLPDGTYSISLRASAGRKNRNISRKIIIDTQAPNFVDVQIASAALTGPGRGQCRVRVGASEDAAISAQVRGIGRVLARVGPRPVRRGALEWSWSGTTSDGRPAPVGSYRILVTARDRAGNESRLLRSCWVGHLVGATEPPRPRPGDLVRVRLTSLAGMPLPSSTRVTLALYRRAGVPGLTARGPLGARVARAVRGPLRATTIRLPSTIRTSALWLTARTSRGFALIRLAK